MSLDDSIKHLVGLVDIPAVLLLLFVAAGLWMALRAQRKEMLNFARMLKDEQDKESAMRLGVLVAIVASTWVLMKAALQNSEHLPQLYWAFLITWSASPVLREAAAKWNGQLPWAKP